MRQCAPVVLAVVTAVLLGPVPATGQVFVAGAVTLPVGTFGDEFTSGWMANAGVGVWQNSAERVGARLEGFFGMNAHKAGGDHKITLMGLLGSATWSLSASGTTTPYLIGSAGYLRQRVQVGDVDGNDGGLMIGGGAGLRMGRLQFEGRYLRSSINSQTTQVLMASVGLVF